MKDRAQIETGECSVDFSFRHNRCTSEVAWRRIVFFLFFKKGGVVCANRNPFEFATSAGKTIFLTVRTTFANQICCKSTLFPGRSQVSRSKRYVVNSFITFLKILSPCLLHMLNPHLRVLMKLRTKSGRAFLPPSSGGQQEFELEYHDQAYRKLHRPQPG